MKRMLEIIFVLCMVPSMHAQNSGSVLNAFKQGNVEEGGNCVSIAIIKAAIGTFGVGHVFVSRQDNLQKASTIWKLRNGDIVELASSEVAEAISRANFVQKGQDSLSLIIKRYADTCFAVMCKHLQVIDSLSSFSESISTLNAGYPTTEIGAVLGVTLEKLPQKCPCNLGDYKHIIVYNTYHAVYATNGQYDESRVDNGFLKLRRLRWKRMGWKCGFLFCGVRGAYKIVN